MDKLRIVRGNDFTLNIPVRSILFVRDEQGNFVESSNPVEIDDCEILQVNLIDDYGFSIPLEFQIVASSVNSKIRAQVSGMLLTGWYGLEVKYVLRGTHYRSYERKVFKIVENNAKSQVSGEQYQGEHSYQVDTMWTIGQEQVVFSERSAEDIMGITRSVTLTKRAHGLANFYLEAGKYYVAISSDTDYVRANIYPMANNNLIEGSTPIAAHFSGSRYVEVDIPEKTIVNGTTYDVDGIQVFFSATYIADGVTANIEVIACKKDSMMAKMLEKHDKIWNGIQDLEIPMSELLSIHGAVSSTGSIVSGDNFRMSNYIPCFGFSKIRYAGLSQDNNRYCIAFFDEKKAFIENGSVIGTGAYFHQNGEVSVPDGARYVIFTTKLADLGYARVAFVNSIVDVSRKVDMIETHPLAGKKIVCLGDSITEFKGDRQSGGMSYPQYLSAITGATVINLGIGGSHIRQRVADIDLITSEDDASSFNYNKAHAALDIVNIVRAACNEKLSDTDYIDIARLGANWLKDNQSDDNTAQIDALESLDWDTVDIVIVLGGTQDWYNGSSTIWGTSADTGATTTHGAINMIVEKLLTNCPQLKLYFATPIIRYVDDNFDTSKEYAVDDVTVYQGNVYKFTSSHQGAWDASDVEQVENNVKLGFRKDAFYSDVKTFDSKTLKAFAEDIATTAKNNHIPVIDLYNTLGWNKFNFSQFFLDTDNTHPYKGFFELARKIASFILSDNIGNAMQYVVDDGAAQSSGTDNPSPAPDTSSPSPVLSRPRPYIPDVTSVAISEDEYEAMLEAQNYYYGFVGTL